MTLVIGYECNDGVVVGADGKSLVFNTGLKQSCEPTEKIHQLTPYKLCAFAGDNNTFVIVKDNLDKLLNTNSKLSDASFKNTISDIITKLKRTIPSNLDGLELLFAEYNIVENQPFICAYRITNGRWQKHPYCLSAHRINKLFQIGYNKPFSLVGNIIYNWCKKKSSPPILEMIPAVYKSLVLATQNYQQYMGCPFSLYKIDACGVQKVSDNEIAIMDLFLAEHSGNPDPYLRQCLSPSPQILAPFAYTPQGEGQLVSIKQAQTQVFKRSSSQQKEETSGEQESATKQKIVVELEDSVKISDERLEIVAQPSFYQQGIKLSQKGDFNSAIKCFDQFIQLNPKDANGYQERAWAYYKLKDYENALKDYDKIIELNSSFI